MGGETIAQDNNGIGERQIEELSRNKKDFMKTFQKEQQQLAREPNKDTVFLDTRPAQIPEDLLNLKGQGDSYVLGISDPCMDTTEAFEMAKHRALAVAGLAKKCIVQYVADFYSNESNGNSHTPKKNKWEEYGKIKASIYWNPKTLQITDSHYTKYNEGIVKLKLPANNGASLEKVNKFTTTASIYHERNKIGPRTNDKWKYELGIKTGNNSSSFYTIVQSNREQEVLSQWAGNKDSICTSYFHYTHKHQNTVQDTSTLRPYYSLKKGLWAGYLKGILNQILLSSQENGEKLNSLQQTHGQDYENVSRTIEFNPYTLTFKTITPLADKVSIEMKVEKQ